MRESARPLRACLGCMLISFCIAVTGGVLVFPFFVNASHKTDAIPVLHEILLTSAFGLPFLLVFFLLLPLFGETPQKHPSLVCISFCFFVAAIATLVFKNAFIVFNALTLSLLCAIFTYFCLRARISAQSASRRKHGLLLAAALAAFILFGFSGGAWLQYRHYTNLLPAQLTTSEILYKAEKSWGFGPGGAEVGMAVYELSEEVALNIQKAGPGFFAALNKTRAGKDLALWKETPMIADKDWTDYMSLPDNHDYSKETPKLSHYLNRYGHGSYIKWPRVWLDTANKALTESGSFYTSITRGSGFILVIPKERKVVYVFSG